MNMKKLRPSIQNLELPIRIIVEDAPAGVTFAMQRGKSELLGPSESAGSRLIFDLNVRVSARDGDGAPNILGPYAQGPAADRFLYLNSGTLAGQTGTEWTRRAKIKTAGISWELVDGVFSAQPGAVLLAQVYGRAKDAGPCCGTVPLLRGGWHIHTAAG